MRDKRYLIYKCRSSQLECAPLLSGSLLCIYNVLVIKQSQNQDAKDDLTFSCDFYYVTVGPRSGIVIPPIRSNYYKYLVY